MLQPHSQMFPFFSFPVMNEADSGKNSEEENLSLDLSYN